MERSLVWVLLSVLICSGLGRAAVADPNTAPVAATLTIGDLSLVHWQPSESYQGGSQFDARLDTPVRMWRAGMPLRDVLADLARQTAVSFIIWPPEADDARVCLTLYLNPQQPPSLRAVMAQLSWVTGCVFACPSGRAGSGTYYLLGTSAGQGVADKLAAETQARREQFRIERQTRQDTARKTAAAAMEESKRALALSRDEAIARYRGVNDALLLNLLDPSRRAAAGFLADLPETDAKELLEGQGGRLSREWSAWSADQQAALKQALGLEQNWPKEGTVLISVDINRGGAVMAMVRTEGRPRPLGRMTGLLSSGSVRRDQEIALRRYLGEVKTPEQEEALRRQQEEAQQADRAARRQQWQEQAAQATAATRAVSQERESLLATVALPDASPSEGLWQMQETVAKATGLNVLSDCFWLAPNQRFRRRQPGPQLANALDALSAACVGQVGRFGPQFGGGGDQDLGLQWGDAGDFLRFRSQHPEIWRAALLPADVQAQLDAWIEPYLVSTSASPEAGDAPLAGDIEKLSSLAGHLNDLQIRLGGAVVYGDPRDPKESRRQAIRRATLEQIAFRLPVLRLMATFTPEQWARAKAEGLRWGYDLTPSQQASEVSRMVARAVPEDRLKDVLIQIGQTEAQTVNRRDGTTRTIPSAPALKLSLDGKLVEQIPLSSTRG